MLSRLTRTLLPILLIAGAVPASQAQQGVVTIEGTRIEGDEELPALVFELPWQQLKFPALDHRDERLMTQRDRHLLERPVVQREIDLHSRLIELTTDKDPITP